MSYYCKGEICPRAKRCLMYLGWKDYVDTFKKPDAEEGFKTGIWFVPENTCIKNNYEDGVFKTD